MQDVSGYRGKRGIGWKGGGHSRTMACLGLYSRKCHEMYHDVVSFKDLSVT